MHDDRSPATASVDDAPLGDWGSLPSPPLIISGAISSFPMSDSFDLSARRGPPPCDDEPSSTSDILFEGERADIPNDAAPIDIGGDIVVWDIVYGVAFLIGDVMKKWLARRRCFVGVISRPQKRVGRLYVCRR